MKSVWIFIFAAILAIAPERARSAEHEHLEAGHHDEVMLSPDAIAKHGIMIERAGKRILAPALSVPGRVEFNAEAQAHVGSVVPGRVTEIKVKRGDEVKKGDALIIIDSPELGEAQSDYLQKKTGAETARSGAGTVKLAAERAQKLFEGKGISRSEMLRREAEFKGASGTMAAAEAALAAAENKLRLLGLGGAEIASLGGSGTINPRMTIRAPLSGRVIEREVTLGEVLHADSDPLLILADMTKLWVIADMPQAQIALIETGAKGQIGISGAGVEALEGTVTFIASQIDRTTRTGEVRLEVDGRSSPLKPGMFVEVEFMNLAGKGDRNVQVLAVPREAVQTVEGETAVFVPVEGEANTFAKRAVTLGTAVGGWIPVKAGLKEGEQIVTRGSFILKADLGKAGAEHEH